MEQIIYSQIFDILTELNVCPAPRALLIRILQPTQILEMNIESSSRSFDAIPTAATSVVPN